ncbi:unnamed protein product [Blepharisma stoltei]|uniref:Ran GTPase-activating protein n=1 Tax=Blepharisma stoltei TaxID=1481888 RepID=A0AAU9JRT6_9CILI|nr:unnamed protein product [Blepharisma stoltei]
MEDIEETIERRRLDIEKECQSKKIDLTAMGLDDLDALTVAISIFKRSDEIETIYLGSNSIGDEGLDAIANSLSKHPELKHLYLGSNLFRESGLNAIANVMPDLINLQTLSLGGAQIDDNLCTSLASSLMAMESCSLRYLFLNGNRIGDEGLLSLIVALTSEKFHLETLHLGDNEFTSSGLKILAEFIENDTSLVKLFLNDNDFEGDGLGDLSEALCANRNLKFISLANCGITDENFKPILACLSVNETLESLHIWNNLLTQESAELILEVLRRHNNTLTDLQIFGNQIEDYESYKEELNEALAKNQALVRGGEIDEEEEKEFAEIIESQSEESHPV